MINAGQRDRAQKHGAPILHRRAVAVAGEVATGRAADRAAIVAQRVQHVIGPVALVREAAVRIGMRDRHRLPRDLHRIQRAAAADMAEIHRDSGAVHLGDQLAPKAGKPAVLGLVAAARVAVPVIVGKLHAAHAELDEDLHQADAVAEQLGVPEADIPHPVSWTRGCAMRRARGWCRGEGRACRVGGGRRSSRSATRRCGGRRSHGWHRRSSRARRRRRGMARCPGTGPGSGTGRA